jgi:hypothetical protein
MIVRQTVAATVATSDVVVDVGPENIYFTINGMHIAFPLSKGGYEPTENHRADTIKALKEAVAKL